MEIFRDLKLYLSYKCKKNCRGVQIFILPVKIELRPSDFLHVYIQQIYQSLLLIQQNPLIVNGNVFLR